MAGEEPPWSSERGLSCCLRFPGMPWVWAGGSSSNLLMTEDTEERLGPAAFLHPRLFYFNCLFFSHHAEYQGYLSKSHIRQETARCHGRKGICSGGWTLLEDDISNCCFNLLGIWLQSEGTGLELRLRGGQCFSNAQNPYLTCSRGSQIIASIWTTWRACSKMDF